MKTKILLSITILMTLIFSRCTSTQTDPYKGLVKIKSSYYLVVCNKTIPVDSGITYKNALDAYNHPNQLCPAGKRIKKINWIIVIEEDVYQDIYTVYNGDNILVMFSKEKQDMPYLFIDFIILIVLSIIIRLALYIGVDKYRTAYSKKLKN